MIPIRRLELSTRIVELDWTTKPYEVVDYVLDGRNLLDWVAPAERAEGAKELAGSYLGLSVGVDWARHLLGYSDLVDDHGRTLLLGCTCTSYECWPLYVRITADDAEVTWSDFAHGFRDWSYADLGPFRFDAVQYRAATTAWSS